MWCNTRAARRLTFLLSAAVAGGAQAQTRPPVRPATRDSVYARARQLVVNGNGAAGRVLVDSMVATAEPDTPGYADALFWRASLAAVTSDAERDYRRIIVDYPDSPRAGDALLQLAQLEATRGDRAAAGHLERYLLENRGGPERGRAGLTLVRLSFEQNDARRGCIALARAMADVPADEVEMRNQLDYYSSRCVGVDTTGSSAIPTASAPPVVAAPSTTPQVRRRRAGADAKLPRESTPPPAATGRFTLQVAAYTSRADAERLAKRLRTRGIEARVVASPTLFRVRVGRYETRADAVAAGKALKTRAIAAFVTEAGPEAR